jgi:hypothetical protein
VKGQGWILRTPSLTGMFHFVDNIGESGAREEAGELCSEGVVLSVPIVGEVSQ